MDNKITKFVSDCFDNQTGKSFKEGINPFNFKTISDLKINKQLAEQFANNELKAITKKGKQLQNKRK